MVDPHDEIADAIRDDNEFPPSIGQRRFRLRQDGDRTNPMREARHETARAKTRERMAAWAKLAVEGDESFQRVEPVDGWDQPVAQQLPTSDEHDVLVRLISAGPDGAMGTPDDLSAVVNSDGTLSQLRTAAERPKVK